MSPISSQSKKETLGDKLCIGDKVDARVCTKSASGKVVDLVNFEFANNNSDNKSHSDHRKVVREAKNIADRFYQGPYISSRSKKNIKSLCVQVARVKGQINDVCLVDNGLYVSTKLGSLRLPTSSLDLRKGRALLERLYDMKVKY